MSEPETEIPTTGEPAVDEILAQLGDLPDLDLARRADVLAHAQERLADVLDAEPAESASEG